MGGLKELLPSLALCFLAIQAEAATIKINSGNGGLTFAPNSTVAAVGDILEFHFFPKNHSVVMGDFSSPCMPATEGGFYSGFFATTAGDNGTTFSVVVNNTDPMVFYCGEGPHCKYGMVGVVNPAGSKTLASYAQGAQSVMSAGLPAAVFGGTFGKTSNWTVTATATPSATSGW